MSQAHAFQTFWNILYDAFSASSSSAHGTDALFLTSAREKLRFTLVAWLQSTGVTFTQQTCANTVLTRRPSNNGLHYKRVRIS